MNYIIILELHNNYVNDILNKASFSIRQYDNCDYMNKTYRCYLRKGTPQN